MKTRILYIGLILLVLGACKKDPVPNGLYDDTPYVIEKYYRFPVAEIPTDNPLTQAKVDLGRKLFYETRLSQSKTMSCGTCHAQANAFTDNGKVLSVNDIGNNTARNSSSIVNLVWSDKGFFWDGRQPTLEDAVEDAINAEQHVPWEFTLDEIKADTMYQNAFARAFKNEEISRQSINMAIASFMRIIISKDSKFDKFTRGEASLTELELEGLNNLFLTEDGDCFHCHGVYPFMTDNDFHDNGLQANINNVNEYVDKGLGEMNGVSTDLGKMKAPPLRNLSYTAPYMHDGRFATLDEVIDFYSEGLHRTPNIDPLMKKIDHGGLQLDAQQKAALKAFLLTLDDPTFIANEEYSNPFE
ncbi:MAG: cytochrome c peroxidase [Chitinophagales bacterium]|nr:cytochrome-c peroxidase [Chitinophagales bacterium]